MDRNDQLNSKEVDFYMFSGYWPWPNDEYMAESVDQVLRLLAGRVYQLESQVQDLTHQLSNLQDDVKRCHP